MCASRAGLRGTRVIRNVAELAVRPRRMAPHADRPDLEPIRTSSRRRCGPTRGSCAHTWSCSSRPATPVAMLVGRIEQLDLTVRAGYRTLYAPRVRSITVVYGGILGDDDEAAFRLLLASLRESLAEGEADVAIFRYLPLDSPFYRIASTEPPLVSRQHVPSSEIHWEFELPDSSDAVLGALSSSSRQKIRRYMRKFETEHEGRFALRRLHRSGGAGRLLRGRRAGRRKDLPARARRRRSATRRPTASGRCVSMQKGWFRG